MNPESFSTLEHYGKFLPKYGTFSIVVKPYHETGPSGWRFFDDDHPFFKAFYTRPDLFEFKDGDVIYHHDTRDYRVRYLANLRFFASLREVRGFANKNLPEGFRVKDGDKWCALRPYQLKNIYLEETDVLYKPRPEHHDRLCYLAHGSVMEFCYFEPLRIK